MHTNILSKNEMCEIKVEKGNLLLFCSDGCTLAGDGLESSLDGLDRATGVTSHALQEEQPRLLVENRVRGSKS